MKMKELFLVVTVFCVAGRCEESQLTQRFNSPDVALLKEILHGYDNRVIARVNNQALTVKVGYTLVQLHSLDEKNQMLTSSGWFQVEWNDDRLKWNSTKFNRTSTVIPSKELWLPDIGFLNSASIYHTSMIKNEFRCVVYSDGSVLWVPGGTYYTTCELNIKDFPFDKQTCYLHLTNWAYNLGEMNLINSSSKFVMDNYKPSAEWHVSETKVNRTEVLYVCCGNVSYPSLYFHIAIERKSLYYIVNIIMPCVILSMLATFTFCVPPDSGEKISLGITLLLSFTVFQLIVAESIPRRSDSVPIISLYISVVTGVVTASIISTIFISQLHHRGDLPIPYCLRRFTFDFLAPCVALKQLKVTHGTGMHLSGRAKNNRRNSRLSISSSATVKLKLLNGTSYPDSLPRINGSYPTSPQDGDVKCEMTSSVETTPTVDSRVLKSIDNHLLQIIECLSEYESRRIESTTSELMKEEWQALGKVYDRVFFVIFVAVMTIITVVFLIPANGPSSVTCSLTN